MASYEKQLDQALSKYPVLLKLERKVGVPKTRLVAGSVALVLGYGLLQLAAAMVISVIVFGYPAFMTIRAMESGSKAEHSLWLAYWVTAAAFQMLEAFTMGGLAHIVPFYVFLKIFFHMWLYLPVTQGALMVYETALRPSFKSLLGNPQFAAAAEKFSSTANKIASEVKKGSEGYSRKISDATAQAVEASAAGAAEGIEATASLSKDD